MGVVIFLLAGSPLFAGLAVASRDLLRARRAYRAACDAAAASRVRQALAIRAAHRRAMGWEV